MTDKKINPVLEKYTLVCGLEIHAELKTLSKMFCGCTNNPFGADQPNIYTCPVCLGMPGGLPVANRLAIENTIKLGLFIGAKINQKSKFDRKNYFYPDLAKGYQISQFDLPFCYGGTIETSEGPVGITRIHLEEDTAKLVHSEINGEKVSLIDFNRSGVPLAEIVSEPDIKTASQAAEYGRQLRETMRYLGIADCDMEKGGMRLEANISLQTPAQAAAHQLPAYKVEVKNINSFNYMEQAIDFEITRQAAILDTDQLPIQETRGFNPSTGKTFPQRVKEDAADYRYFPDPDLPPIEISDDLLASWRDTLPPTKTQIVNNWTEKYQIEARYCRDFAINQETIDWSEALFALAAKSDISPNKLINFLVNKKITDAEIGVSSPVSIIEQFKKLTTTNDMESSELSTIITQVIKDNPDALAKYQAGQKQIISFFIGQIMRQTQGKSNPAQITPLLGEILAQS